MTKKTIECTAISQCIQENMIIYFNELEGEDPVGVYEMVVMQVEKSLIDFMLTKYHGHQTKVAKVLGISRTALKTKINRYDLPLSEYK